MKNMLPFLLLLSVLGGSGLGSAQTAKTSPELPQFSVAVSAANKLAKAGSSVVIEVALTNVSDQTIGLSAEAGQDGGQWYTVDVRRQNGTMASALRHVPPVTWFLQAQ